MTVKLCPDRPDATPVLSFSSLEAYNATSAASTLLPLFELPKIMTSVTESLQFELQPYKSLENDVLETRIQAVRDQLGSQLLILGHHYQQDEVIAQSDLRGDSYLLSQRAADSTDCRHIVFCGVHFMAETADILANRPEKLAQRNVVVSGFVSILPDMGCRLLNGRHGGNRAGRGGLGGFGRGRLTPTT